MHFPHHFKSPAKTFFFFNGAGSNDAFETIYFQNNTSIIPDEQLAHRLGLLPIAADPEKFEFHGLEYTDTDTIMFQLRVKYPKNDKESQKNLSKDVAKVGRFSKMAKVRVDQRQKKKKNRNRV